MPRQVLDAADILPGQKGWTCIVQVVERHPVLYKELPYYPFQKRHRHYLLTDMKGTKVKAVMFDNDIDFFERSLQPFKRYKISNASVTVPAERFQLEDYRFSWIITTKTPVEPIVDAKPYVLPCKFEVSRFTELHKFAETDANIAIRALVVHRFPIVDITNTKSAKDYVVVNEEEVPMVLRLWKNLLTDYDPSIDGSKNEPVTIIASNLEVRTFHGLSLATRNNTYLIEDAPLSDNLDLKKWYAENKMKVVDWIKNKAYENNSKFFIPPKEEEILDLTAAMKAFENAKTCWVKGTVRLSVTRNPLYYVLCANCQMIVDAGVDWNIKCSGCTVLSPMEVRISLPVTLNDANTNIRSIIKSPDAEKLCPFSAIDIKKLEDEGKSPLNDISIAMDNTEVVCFVKYYDKQGNTATVRRYVILKTYTTEEIKQFIQHIGATTSTTTAFQSATSDAASADAALLSPASGKTHVSETQFFTPTTKKVLQQISQEHLPIECSSSHPSTAKRSISFGTLTAEDLGNVESQLPAPQSKKITETPKKKNKGEDKQL